MSAPSGDLVTLPSTNLASLSMTLRSSRSRNFLGWLWKQRGEIGLGAPPDAPGDKHKSGGKEQRCRGAIQRGCGMAPRAPARSPARARARSARQKFHIRFCVVLHPTKHLPPHRAILGLRRGGDAVAEPVSVVVVGRARAWIAGIALYVFHGATGENT